MAFEQRRAEAKPPPERQLVLFGIGSVVYGLPIERVREVVNPQSIVELPHAPASVIGVADHRGDVVPVIDLRAKFGLPPLTDPDAQRRVKWIMVDVGVLGSASRIVATVVDTVHNVFMTREVLRPPPPLGGGEATRGIAGVLSRGTPGATTERGLIFVLDLEPLRALAEPIPETSAGGT
jgi:purine-binding chemotaxis protein CheW